MQRYTVYFIWKLLYKFQVVPPPTIRSAYNCIYSIWYLSRRYCYLPLSWESWNWFDCAAGGACHPQHTHLLHFTKQKDMLSACISECSVAIKICWALKAK